MFAPTKTVKGTVKWFSDSKGYGFLCVDGDTQDVFVHYSAITDDGGFKTLAEDQRVEFDLVDGPKGFQATNVRKLGTVDFDLNAQSLEVAANAINGGN